MSSSVLLFETLRYYWRAALAVSVASAVATAALVGALVVGDSLRGSLHDQVLRRLGRVDHAVLSSTFFPETLRAGRSSEAAEGTGEAAPVLLLRASVAAANGGRRASGVGILGVDARFARLFPNEASALGELGGGGRPLPVALSRSLADELEIAPGQDAVLSLPLPSDVPRESLLGSTEPSELVRSLRVRLAVVVPDVGAGAFSVAPQQGPAKNLLVDLSALQRALNLQGRVNAVLFDAAPTSGASAENSAGDAGRSGVAAQATRAALRAEVGLADVGLEARVLGGQIQIMSREILIRPEVEVAVRRWAKRRGSAVWGSSTYLANAVSRPPAGGALGQGDAGAGPSIPYSTVAALESGSSAAAAFEFEMVAGVPASGDDQIVLNAWAAQDLGVRVGDRVDLDYWEVGAFESLVDRRVELVVSGIAAMTGLAADRELVPPFPGVALQDDMADWEPPFPVDLSRIRGQDEQYWDDYKTTPKFYITSSLGERLWSNRFGFWTALRLSPAAGESIEAFQQSVEAELAVEVGPQAAGIEVVALRDAQLRAAGGATDFGMLFLGFSLFLIVAAVLLAALLFRLVATRRVREIGALLAIGYPVRRVVGRLGVEGLVLASFGTLLGVGLAVVYARLLLAALATRWSGAVGGAVGGAGRSFLELHVTGTSLLIGAVVALAVTALALLATVRRLARHSPIALLRGDTWVAGGAPRRRSAWTASISLLLGLGLLAASFAVPVSAAAPLFFGVGAFGLVFCIAAFLSWLRRDQARPVTSLAGLGLLRLASRNAGLFAGRSALSVSLVAAATFVIVAVGAYGHRFGEELRDKASGAGGFTHMATSDVAIFSDLADPKGRFELGWDTNSQETWSGVEVYPLRVVPGDDTSCLNLYQPERPRLLGVSASLRDRGGFAFQGVAAARENPWQLLAETIAPESGAEDGDPAGPVVPAIGDYNSVMWILKSGLGKDVLMSDELGRPFRLRIVGLLKRSIFQGELLIAEEKLLELFPSRSGFSAFLFTLPESSNTNQQDTWVASVEDKLSRFGFDLTATAQRLASFQAVENTYLGTFRSLGGLGLLLGTIGLAVVLLRGVEERRSELALMKAVGFSGADLGRLVVAENLLLLLVGLGSGTATAMVAVMPHLLGEQATVPWVSLAWTLGSILGVGLLASVTAVTWVSSLPLVASLRSE